MWNKLALALWVGFGGFIGTIARYLTGLLINQSIGTKFPFATFLINIIGSFLLGVISELANISMIKHEWNLMLSIGICGGFTTFSSFMLENANLVNDMRYWHSFLYIGSSVVLGFAFLFFGRYLVKIIFA